MPVTDALRAIADRADRELDGVHDFFQHSKIVWRSFQTLVAEGHKVADENLATGTRIDQDGLVRLAPRYTREYLATFTFRQFVSAFEAFLFNFLHRLLLHHPWQLSEKQLEVSTVLKAANRDEIVSGVIPAPRGAGSFQRQEEIGTYPFSCRGTTRALTSGCKSGKLSRGGCDARLR